MSVHDLMIICSVSLLIIGQNDINPTLLHPIVASICKVLTVKKPRVQKFSAACQKSFFSEKLQQYMMTVDKVMQGNFCDFICSNT